MSTLLEEAPEQAGAKTEPAARIRIAAAEVPLCVDCDGTLIRTDLLHEAVFLLLKQAPWKLLLALVWLCRGKAYLKEKLAASVVVDWSLLPLRTEVVELAKSARTAGRKVFLVTASHHDFAQGLADTLGIFDGVIATSGRINLCGVRKAAKLVETFGEGGYDYIGNSSADVAVWRKARRSIVVTAGSSLENRARKVSVVDRVISAPRPSLGTYIQAARLHQWVKNLLIFVPLGAAHQLQSWQILSQALIAFLAFGACASSVYLINDLLDLESDRRHKTKKNRPLASGSMPIWHGCVLTPALLGCAVLLAMLLPLEFGLVLGGYFVLTLAYSWRLKRQVIVDVLILAGLYTIRVIGGGAATGIVPSFWLLAFSMFIFLSLAIVKRYSELLITLQQNGVAPSGRGYLVDDLSVLMSAGTSSSMAAVLVVALYINNPETAQLYAQPLLLWLIPPLLLYWVSRLWMKTHRGEIDDDPVVFAIRDWQSILVAALCGTLFVLSATWR